MPKIPTYVPRVGVPSVELPNIPTDAASAVPNALAKAGATIFAEGVKWEEQIARAQESAQLSSAMSNATVSLHDLRNSILTSGEFNTDPGSARGKWQAGSSAISQNIAETMNSPRAKKMFMEHYEKLSASHTTALSDEIRKKQVEIVKGAGLRALENFQISASKAPNDLTFAQIEKDALSAVHGMISSGAVGYDDGIKLWDHWKKSTGSGRAHLELSTGSPQKVLDDLQRGASWAKGLDPNTEASIISAAKSKQEHLESKSKTLLNEYEKMRREKAENYAYSEVRKVFNLDGDDPNFAGALNWVQSADTAKHLGMVDQFGQPDREMIGKVAGAINTERERQRHIRDESKKDETENIGLKFTELYSQKKLSPDAIIASGLPPEKQKSWLEAIDRQAAGEDKTDKAVYNKLVYDIYSGKIQRREQITEHTGRDISGKDIPGLIETWEKAQDPSRSKFFNMAIDAYKRKFKGDEEALARAEEFAMMLNAEMKKSGKDGKEISGEDIFRLADDLMKPLEDRTWSEWWNNVDTKWQRKAVDWLKMPAVPNSSAVPTSTSNSGSSYSPSNPISSSTPTMMKKQTIVYKPVDTSTAINPKVIDKISELVDQGVPDHKIAEYLKEVNIDPKLYGLEN